ncbi:MAG: DUF6273 domain-containing protein [Candidatus Promineifilaceae bacterium]
MHDNNLAAAPHWDAKPGDTILFGVYPQTADGEDRTPIRWLVLQNLDGELFVLSEKIVDCRRYHGKHVDITWRECDLRRWLNETFYNAAFNTAEQELIRTTRCTDNGEGSPDTEDRVFLLSVTEIKAFTDAQGGSDTVVRRRTIGTEFARAPKPDGCRLYVYDKGVEKDYIIEDGEKFGCSWWWTRTQLQIQDGRSSRAAFIGARSNIKSYGRVDLAYYGVRPAAKLDLR